MMLRTGLRAALLHGCTITLLALILTACGGGGGSIKLPPTNPADDHADAPGDATFIRGGGGVIRGSIDYAGDSDWFRFEGRPGVTYTIRADMINLPAQPRESVSIGFRAANGVDGIPHSADTDLTGNVFIDTDFRFALTPEVRAPFFIRIESTDPFLEDNNYRWIVTSSENAQTFYSHVLLRDRDIAEFDDDGQLLATHPVDFLNLTPVWESTYLFGDPNVQVGQIFSANFFIPEIILVGNTDPETPAIHLHLGVPEVVDTQPDPIFNPFPFDPNDNQQVGPAEEHRILFDFNLEEPLFELPRDVWHALIGHDTYIDIHVSDNFEAVPAPLTSTPPFGGFSFFESEFRLTGDQAVPATGLDVFDCTLLYLADQKTFQWDHTRFEFDGRYLDDVRLDAVPPSELLRENPPTDVVGAAINIRNGFPGQEGSIVIPLGAVVGPVQDAAESGVLDTNGDIKNVQRTLTDSEVTTLRGLTYGTRQTQTIVDITGSSRQVTFLGWYIEIEDGGASVVRYDAALSQDRFLRGFEVAATDPMPVQVRNLDSTESTGVEHLGEVTFVTDYSAGGIISVWVDGMLLSHLNAAFSGEVPLCGEGEQGETVRVLYEPGMYGYEAEAEDGTRWVGTVEIDSAGECVTVALLESEAN